MSFTIDQKVICADQLDKRNSTLFCYNKEEPLQELSRNLFCQIHLITPKEFWKTRLFSLCTHQANITKCLDKVANFILQYSLLSWQYSVEISILIKQFYF